MKKKKDQRNLGNKLFLLSFCVWIVGLSIQSCKPDPKEDPDVPANPKSKFLGTWKCSENSLRDGASQPFYITISDSVNDYVLISNFYQVGSSKKAKATVNGSNINLIAGQNLSGKVILKGSGLLENSSTIKMNYIIDDGNPHTDTCTATLTK